MSYWGFIQKLSKTTFICGYCGKHVGSDSGWLYTNEEQAFIYICPICEQPNYFDKNDKQYPGPPFGKSIEGISVLEIGNLYEEARNCMKVDAYTASVLCCRKLLMNIAVQKGAKEGEKFIDYIRSSFITSSV